MVTTTHKRMKPDVATAIQELRDGLPGHNVRTQDDGVGGAFVIVDDLDIGDSFAPPVSWLGFHITFGYPEASVYPHFMDARVRYVGEGETPNAHADGNLPAAMSRGATMAGFDLPAVQISRKSNHSNPETDSALQKLLRILEFLKSR
jgi:hypothetical protein